METVIRDTRITHDTRDTCDMHDTCDTHNLTPSLQEQTQHLAGPMALLKYQCTRMAEFVSSEGCQIFGGRALPAGCLLKIIN